MDFNLDSLAPKQKSPKPSDIEAIEYLFWDKGHSQREVDELPIPYIISILNTHSYYRELEEKAQKKANRKK